MSIRVKYLANAVRASDPTRCCCCSRALRGTRRSVRLLGAMAVVHPDDEGDLPLRGLPVMGQWSSRFPQESFGPDLGDRLMMESCAALLGLEWSRPVASPPTPDHPSGPGAAPRA